MICRAASQFAKPLLLSDREFTGIVNLREKIEKNRKNLLNTYRKRHIIYEENERKTADSR